MKHIAIVGAGIGGLAAALALAGAGQRVTLYERAPALDDIGAGLQLSPNACRALRGLGVLDVVARDAVRLDALRIGRGRDATVLARLPLGDVVLRRHGAPFLVTRRADLHRALLQRALDAKAISLVMGAGLSGWTSAGTKVRLAFGDAAISTIEVDALVGADGQHSVVRATLAPNAPAPRRRGIAWRSMIEAAALPERFGEPASNLWLGRGAHLVHYPVAGGRLINVIAAIDGPRDVDEIDGGWSGKGDPASIATRFSGWGAPLRQLIAAAPQWGTWPLADRPPLPAWSRGPVTLLGDAAHPMLPFLAQGAAQALEDAVALGTAVAALPDDLGAAFQRYEAARRLRATRVQTESRRQATIYHLPPPASTARDMVLRATPAHKLLTRYDWLYAG